MVDCRALSRSRESFRTYGVYISVKAGLIEKILKHLLYRSETDIQRRDILGHSFFLHKSAFEYLMGSHIIECDS